MGRIEDEEEEEAMNLVGMDLEVGLRLMDRLRRGRIVLNVEDMIGLESMVNGRTRWQWEEGQRELINTLLTINVYLILIYVIC